MSFIALLSFGAINMLKTMKFKLKLVQLYLEHAILNCGVENSSLYM